MNEPISQAEFPESVQRVLREMRAALSPAEIFLFGSRSTGQEKPTSDFDFAVKGAEAGVAWTRFHNYVTYDAPTLFGIDLVRYEVADEKLKNNIDRDARLIYEPAA
jgi:predicted nucleotidyltransferase